VNQAEWTSPQREEFADSAGTWPPWLPGSCGKRYLGITAMLKPRVETPDDRNPQETGEWMEALDEIVDQEGPDRASYLLERLMERASNLGVQPPLRWNTPYINTIKPEEEVAYPGDRALERRIKSLVRWNAVAMVVRPINTMTASAATWRPTRRSPRWPKSASITSSVVPTTIRRARSSPAITSISRATLLPASTREPLWKGG
jgi:hypothetical protein